ncbi:GbsR/MarR family transcriptional regulator [Halorussus caseinilyticus]|nr:hypothetical protein [Halorussus sp. DT72]
MGTEGNPVKAVRDEVIDSFEHSAEIYGLNRSYGRLYGILFFAGGPVSLDELVEESGYAKSTVSTAMKQMEQLHLVYRRSVPGEGKKAFYEAESHFWRVVQEFLRREVQHEIRIMTETLESAEADLEAIDDEAEHDLERIRSLKQTYDQSQALLDVLTSASVDDLDDLVERLRRD